MARMGDPGITAWECSQKWKNMMATFKRNKNRDRQSGAGGRAPWPYFNLMDELTAGNVAVNPKHIMQCGAAGSHNIGGGDDDEDEVCLQNVLFFFFCLFIWTYLSFFI